MTEASDGDYGVRADKAAPNSEKGRATGGRPCTALIEGRASVRDYIMASLRALEPGHDFLAFDDVDAWARSADVSRTSLVILCTLAPPGQPAADIAFDAWLRQVLEQPQRPPIAVLSDHESADLAAFALNSGASAFLSAAMLPQMMVKVLAILRAGGAFIPASVLAAMTPGSRGDAAVSDLAEFLSPQERAVARALRKGQPNREIARELGFTEGSVRRHVRTVLRKLKARNRTEAVFLLRELEDRSQAH